MTEENEESLRATVVKMRHEGLTIDQLDKQFPSLSRSKIGRWVRGIPRGTETSFSRGEGDYEETNDLRDREETEARDSEDTTLLEKNRVSHPASHLISQNTKNPNPMNIPIPTPSTFGRVSLSQESINNVRNMLSKSGRQVFDSELALARREMMRKHDGNSQGTSIGTPYMEGLSAMIERLMMLRQANEIVARMFPRGSNGYDRRLEDHLRRLESKIDKKSEASSLIQAMKLGSDITARAIPQTQQRALADYLGEYISISQAIEKMSSNRHLSAKEQMELEKMRASQKVYAEVIKGIIDFGKELGVALAPGLREKILSLGEKREMPPPQSRQIVEVPSSHTQLPPEEASLPEEPSELETEEEASEESIEDDKEETETEEKPERKEKETQHGVQDETQNAKKERRKH